MQVFINSKQIETDAQTLSELLKSQGYDDKSIAIECDKNVISREEWSEFRLFDGVKIEIVEFVAGG